MRLRAVFGNAHYFASALLALAVVPAFYLAHLPLHFDWTVYFTVYGFLILRAIFAAVFLYVICFPREFLRKLRNRQKSQSFPSREILAVLLPGAYVFLVLVLVFSYNDVIARFRFDARYDLILNRVDSWILGGHTVLDLSRFLLAKRPWISDWSEVIYEGMYTQIGASIILLGMRSGLKRNMQFVGTIATAYYLALLCFLLIPATGPFFIRHGNEGGVSSGVYQMQNAVIAQLNMIKTGQRFSQIGLDYYIALPCMHIVQPLIALWFLRRWKVLAIALAAYDVLLVAAILLLDQHYVIDLIGGVALSALAIVIVTAFDLM